MKYLLIAIGWCLVSVGLAQTAEVRTYGGIFFDEARAITEWDDGYALVGTTASEDDGNSDILLVKLNDDLTVAWTQSIGGSASEQGRDVAVTSDGDLIVLGQTASGAIGAYDILAYRIDINGNIIWQEHYGSPDWDLAASLVAGINAFFIAGTTYGETPGGSRMILYSIDGDGELLTETTYDILADAEAKDLAFHDDAVYLSGTRSFEGGNSQAVLRKVTTTGAVLWEQVRDSVDYDGASVDVSDLGVAAGFSLRDPNESDTWDIQMIGFDHEGNETWSFWADTPDPSNQRTADIRYVTGPDLLVSATTDTYGQGGEGALTLRTATDGIFLGVTTIGAGADEFAHQLIEDSEGRIVIVGQTDSYGNGNKDAYLIRLPDRVIVDIYEQEVVELTAQDAFVSVDQLQMPLHGPYPNPFGKHLHLPEHCTQWSLHTLNGELVQSGHQDEVATEQLAPGMYVMTWIVQGEVHRTRLIKE